MVSGVLTSAFEGKAAQPPKTSVTEMVRLWENLHLHVSAVEYTNAWKLTDGRLLNCQCFASWLSTGKSKGGSGYIEQRQAVYTATSTSCLLRISDGQPTCKAPYNYAVHLGYSGPSKKRYSMLDFFIKGCYLMSLNRYPALLERNLTLRSCSHLN